MRKDTAKLPLNPNRALFVGAVLVAALGLTGCNTYRTAEIEYYEDERTAELTIDDHTGKYEYAESFERDGDIERYWAASLADGRSFSDRLDWEGDSADRKIRADWGDKHYEYDLELGSDGDHEYYLELEAKDYEYQETYDYDPSDDGTSRFDIERVVEVETDNEEFEIEHGIEPDDYERNVQIRTARLDYDEDFDAEDVDRPGRGEIEWYTAIDDHLTGAEYDNEFEYQIGNNEIEREIDYETASGAIELTEQLKDGIYDLELEGVANGQIVDVEIEGARVTPPMSAPAPTEVYRPVANTVLVEQDEGPEVFVVYLSSSDDIFAACDIDSKEAYFRLDSANLSSRSRDRLDEVAECLTRGPLKGANIEIIGYADPRASDAYNLDLGADRAQSVADFLTSQGVSQSRISTRSMGESQAHTDSSLWPYDRRVELRIKR